MDFDFIVLIVITFYQDAEDKEAAHLLNPWQALEEESSQLCLRSTV